MNHVKCQALFSVKSYTKKKWESSAPFLLRVLRVIHYYTDDKNEHIMKGRCWPCFCWKISSTFHPIHSLLLVKVCAHIRLRGLRPAKDKFE